MPNIFTQNLGETPRQALNWRLGYAILCFGLMGASRGGFPLVTIKLFY